MNGLGSQHSNHWVDRKHAKVKVNDRNEPVSARRDRRSSPDNARTSFGSSAPPRPRQSQLWRSRDHTSTPDFIVGEIERLQRGPNRYASRQRGSTRSSQIVEGDL